MGRQPTYTDLGSVDLGKTLAQKLIPVADRIRNLYTKFGMRPYTVRVVRVRWSDENRGVGTPQVIKELDILPTPLVLDMSTMTEIVQPVGLDEVGMILVTEISGRFTDNDLRYLDPSGKPPDPSEEVFYEIEFKKPDGTGDKRKFWLRSAPHYFAGRFMWQIRLERAHQDRDSQGDYR